MRCPRCVAAYGETGRPEHFASDPTCGFDVATGAFVPGNWNCATLNALRDLCESDAMWHEDDYAALLRVPEDAEADDERGPVFLLLRWYKSRGRTDQVYWWCDVPRPLTFAEAERVLAAVGR